TPVFGETPLRFLQETNKVPEKIINKKEAKYVFVVFIRELFVLIGPMQPASSLSFFKGTDKVDFTWYIGKPHFFSKEPKLSKLLEFTRNYNLFSSICNALNRAKLVPFEIV